MTKTWKSVRDSEAYKSLSSEERDAARRQYFLDVVAPKVNTDELPDAFKQFDAETAPTFKNKVKELAGDAVDTIGESMGFGGKSPGLADTQTVPGVIDATTQPTPMTWEGINAKTRAEQAARDQARIILLEQERADPSKTPAQLADLERELADTRAKIGVASPATEAPQVDVASTMLKPDAGAFDQLVGEKEKPDWELFDQRGFMPAQADLKKRIDAKQRLDELKAIRARTGANQITAENILTGAQKASDIAAQKVIQAGGDVDAANQAGAQAAADALNPGAVSNMPENIQFQQDNPLASAALSGTAKFVGGAYGAADAVHKAIDPANHIGAVVDYFTGLGEPDFGKVADKLNAMGEDFTTAMQKRDFSVALSQGQGLEWMLTSALGNAPSLASSAIGMFNPAAAGVMLGTMAASAGGGQYRELINQGYDQSIAMLSGIAHATLEYALERVPIEVGQRLLTEFKALSADARANLGRRIVGAMSVGAGMAGTEGLEELGTQIGQNTADIATGYAQAAVGGETPSTKRMKEKSVLDGAMNAFMGGVAGGATHGGAIAASVMMPDGTQQQVDPSAAAAEMARQSALNAWAGNPLTRGAASLPPPTGPLTQSLAAAPIAPAVPPVGAAPTVPPMGTDDGTGLADESVPVDAINAEELLGTPEVERTPESFAAEIADGKTLDTPEDIQYYQNNKDAVEAELNRLAAIGWDEWDEQSTDQATPEGEGLAAQPDQVAAQQGAQQVSATDQAAQEVATAQDTSTPRIALNIQEIKRKNGAIGTQGVSELQVRDVLTHVAGMSIPENATMREMVKAFKDSPEAQQRMRDFTAANPLKGVMLPDGTIHIQDGHHRAFLLDQAGDSTIPSIIKDYAVPSTSGATDGRGNPLQEVPEVVAPSSAVPGADLPGSGDIAVGAGDGTGMVGSSAPDMPVSGSGTDVPVRDAEPGREAVEESVFDKRYPDAKSAENVIKFRKLKDVQVFKDGDGFRIGAKVSNKPAPSDNLIQRIKQLGGINTRYRSDVIGDKAGAPGLFSNTGKGLDDLATELKADGFDIDTDEAGGGVDALTRLIQRAVMGESILSLAGQEKAVQKQLEQEYRSGLKEAIDQEGGTYRKNATTKQLEAMLEELRAKEAMMERESIQGDINLAEDQSDELVSRNVTEAEFMAAMGFTEEEANEINAISEKPVEDVTEGTPEESDGARADQGQDQETGEGSKQEEGLSSDQADAKQEPADAKQQTGTPELELIGQTPEEVAAEERARAEQAKRAKAELDRIEAEAKQKRIDAEIAARQEASAENFVLGQSAEDALAGQGDIFSQAEKPATNRYTPPKSDKEARSRWVGELGNGDPVRGPGHEAMLDAVGKALDAGLFYTKEFNKFVADVLGVTDQSAFAVDRTEGGPFGYEVYYARKVVEKERADNRNKDIGEKLRLSVGENIGRLRLNDGKIASASTIASVGDTSAVIMAKRGPQTIKVTLTFDSLMAYAERADNDYLARKVAIYAQTPPQAEAPQDKPSQPQELPAEVLETPVNATSSVQAEAASGVPVEKQARTLTEDGRASDGKPINPGDTFRTLSGRTTTPYPKQKSEKYASQWLIDNAIEEAKSRGDGFNETAFGGEKVMKGGGIPPASRDSMLMYLFGQQPVVVPSILKPLTASNRNAKPGLTIDDIPPMFLQKLMVKLPVLNTKTNQYQNGEANALEALTETRSDIDKMKALLNCLTA